MVKKVVRSASSRFMVLGVKYVKSPIKNSYNFFSKPWINRSNVPDNDSDKILTNASESDDSDFIDFNFNVVDNLNQLPTPIYQKNMVIKLLLLL